jgi:hypothetical protein
MEMKLFFTGIIVGAITGALIISNSNKARLTLQETQEKVIEKTEELAEKCKKNKNTSTPKNHEE